MKKIFFLVISIAVCIFNCQGQSAMNKPSVLYIVHQDNKVIKTTDLIINPNDIQTLNVLPRNDSSTNQGKVKEDVVMAVFPKPNIKLLDFKMLLDNFNVDKMQRNLPVKIDGSDVDNPPNIISTVEAVYKIDVDESNHYIDIITKLEHEKKGSFKK